MGTIKTSYTRFVRYRVIGGLKKTIESFLLFTAIHCQYDVVHQIKSNPNFARNGLYMYVYIYV